MLFDILIGSLYFGTIGLYSRYLFYKIIGKKKSLAYLRGQNMNELKADAQRIYNLIVGIVIGSVLLIFVAYLIFS